MKGSFEGKTRQHDETRGTTTNDILITGQEQVTELTAAETQHGRAIVD